MSKITVKKQNTVLVLCSKPYLSYSHMGQMQLTPVTYEPLESATSFSSTQCYEGIVGIKGKELRIIQIEKLGDLFSQKVLPTRYTPTKLQVNPVTNHLLVIEKDFGCPTLS